MGCSFKNIRIPGSVQIIGEKAFLCSSLEKVTHFYDLKNIGNEAFPKNAEITTFDN